jgi:CRISPR-associated endonuclease Cas1
MQPQTSRPPDGIHVASGYGLKIHVERGHLVVHEGIGIDRETRRFGRATSGLQRLVVIGHTGFVTLEALRWIRDVGASFAQIGRDGEVIASSAADRFHNTKLRRAQATAAESQLGLLAMRQLAADKLEQQLARVEAMPQPWPPKPNGGKGQVDVAAVIQRELEKLRSCETLEALRASESVAGRWYWQTLAGLAVSFDARWRTAVPDHWRLAGPRTSPPSGFKSSRKAATPFHALINYGYAILETEATIALQAHGFAPGLGILHTDKRYRGSLAHDLMEPVRPVVDGLVIDLVQGEGLARGDVYETREGVCRLGDPLARRLARWAPEFRRVLEEQARIVAGHLLGDRGVMIPRPARKRNPAIAGKGARRNTTPASLPTTRR